MSFKTIQVKKVEDHIGIITLNRPECLNAVSEQMHAEMLTALDSLEGDGEIRVVILTGAGRAFCVGGDLSGGETGEQVLDERDPEAIRQRLRHGGARAPLRLHELDVPTIAMVNGAAVGGGFDCALACDLRMASDKARFRVGLTGIGAVPAGCACWILPRIVGMPRAAELLFTDRFIEAEEAEKMGLVNKVVPAQDLERETLKLARDIAQLSSLAVKLTKRVLHQGMISSLESVLEFAATAQPIAFLSEDFQKSIAAFREKRKAANKGR